MKYTSDKIQSIVTSPSALEGLDYIQNIYHEATVALWILQANGLPMDEISGIAEELKLQVLPQTATWALNYWEEMLGLPTNISLPLEQRRKMVMLRKLTRAPLNPYKVQNMISAITGEPCIVEENTGKNTFSLLFKGIPKLDYIKHVRKTLDMAKPAHLIYSLTGKDETIVTNKNRFLLYDLAFAMALRNADILYAFEKLQMKYDFCNKEVLGQEIAMGYDFWNKNTSVLSAVQFAASIQNLGIWYIALDGKRFLDGSWNIDFWFRSVKLNEFQTKSDFYNLNALLITKMEVLSSFLNKHSNSIGEIHRHYIENLMNCSVEKMNVGVNKQNTVSMKCDKVLYAVPMKNKHDAMLDNIQIFTFTRNLGLEYVHLDGEKLLDGSWDINFKNRSVQFYDLLVEKTITNQNSLIVPKMALYTSMKNIGSTTCTLVTEGIGYLNGIDKMNGSRSLNAGIHEYEL